MGNYRVKVKENDSGKSATVRVEADSKEQAKQRVRAAIEKEGMPAKVTNDET